MLCSVMLCMLCRSCMLCMPCMLCMFRILLYCIVIGTVTVLFLLLLLLLLLGCNGIYVCAHRAFCLVLLQDSCGYWWYILEHSGTDREWWVNAAMQAEGRASAEQATSWELQHASTCMLVPWEDRQQLPLQNPTSPRQGRIWQHRQDVADACSQTCCKPLLEIMLVYTCSIASCCVDVGMFPHFCLCYSRVPWNCKAQIAKPASEGSILHGTGTVYT